MKYFWAALSCFLLAVIYVSAMPQAKLFGAAPDLLLVFAVCWAMIRGQDEVLGVIVIAGFFRDFTTGEPVGTSVLALTPIALLATVRELRLVDNDFVPALAVAAVGSLLYQLIAGIVIWLTGEHIGWWTLIGHRLLAAMLVNVLVTPLLYLPLRWISGDLRSQAPRLGPTLGF
ncbi:MAG TPA: rod shape-determining protein MreD [Dehalococcoidia bacterium]|nr:rod shape-determining protein MreD [Dehalococcoidia bacterium]